MLTGESRTGLGERIPSSERGGHEYAAGAGLQRAFRRRHPRIRAGKRGADGGQVGEGVEVVTVAANTSLSPPLPLRTLPTSIRMCRVSRRTEPQELAWAVAVARAAAQRLGTSSSSWSRGLRRQAREHVAGEAGAGCLREWRAVR